MIRVTSSTQYLRVDSTGAVTMVLAGPAGPAGAAGEGGEGGVSDGDKGDITVSSSGTVWTIDNDVVSNAKAANMAESTIKGRAASAGTGDPTDLTATQVRTILNVEDGAEVNDTAAEILTKLLTVDGPGSGLDADTLDGTSSAGFQAAGAAAGGVLAGTYPNPSFAVDMATQAELDAKVTQNITNGVTTTAPSEDAVFDALALKAPLASPTFTGTVTIPDDAYDASAWNGSAVAVTKNAVRDKIEDILDGVTFSGDISVPDEAYDATNWNGSLEVPTKNAVRDKFESLSSGVKYQSTVIPAATHYITHPLGSNTTSIPGSSAANANQRMWFMPIWLGAAITVDRIGVELTVNGDAGSVIRLGIYAADGTGGLPSTLILDAGTVAADGGAAAKLATISQSLSAGLVYLAAVWQGGVPTTAPTLRTIGVAGASNMWAGIGTSMNFGNLSSQLAQASVSGALPSTATPVSSNDSTMSTPRIAVRIA